MISPNPTANQRRLLVWGACGSARSVSRRIGALGDRLVWGVALTRWAPVTARNQRGCSGKDDDQHEQLPIYIGKIRKCEPDHNLILIAKNLEFMSLLYIRAEARRRVPGFDSAHTYGTSGNRIPHLHPKTCLWGRDRDSQERYRWC